MRTAATRPGSAPSPACGLPWIDSSTTCSSWRKTPKCGPTDWPSCTRRSRSSIASPIFPDSEVSVNQYVFFFGGGKADGNKDMKDLLGGKGAGLAEMTNAGLPVPPGFTVSTAACNLFVERGGSLPEAIHQEIGKALERLEALMGKKLGAA